MRKLLIAAVTAGLLAAALVLVIPSIGAADPKPPVGAHRHFIVTPTGAFVAVGPDLCDNADDPAVQQAFANFHWNVHNGCGIYLRALDRKARPRGGIPPWRGCRVA
jgi:hypothetical protein